MGVNGQQIGTHRGGFDPFDFDITNSLKPGVNELIVSAWNPVRADVPDAQVIGKQRVRPGSIFYTSATGIWQSVWLEPVPAAYIASLKITPDIDSKSLHLTVQDEGATDAQVSVAVTDGMTHGAALAHATGKIELGFDPADP